MLPKKKKHQFGGQLHKLVPEFKPWGYSTFYAKKDTAAIGNAAQNLQNIYEDRLKSKNDYLKAINDLDLGPQYGKFKQEKSDELRNQLNQNLAENNNDITSDNFAKGMIDMVGKTMADPKLATAKWNYAMSKDYITKRDELSKEGKYNPMFDPNAQTYDKIKSGEDLWTPWDYKAIVPFYDYNTKLSDIAKGVAADTAINIKELSDYDSWVTKTKSISEQKVFDYINSQKEGFFAGPEGTTFSIVAANNYNKQLQPGQQPVKFDANGYPVPDAGYIKYRDFEFTKLVTGIAKGVSYVEAQDASISTAQGKLSMDQAQLKAQADKDAADATAAAKQKEEEKDREPGLFAANSAPMDTMAYYQAGIATSFDQEASYNDAYKNYDTTYNQYKNQYATYKFTDVKGTQLDQDELLKRYMTEGLSGFNISNNGADVSLEQRKQLEESLNKVVYAKNIVKVNAQTINVNDKQILDRLLTTTDGVNGQRMFTKLPQTEDVALSNGKSVSVGRVRDAQGNELLLVTDTDKGYVDKIVTPYEFKEMYKAMPKNLNAQSSQAAYQYEQEIENRMRESQKEFIRKNHPNESAVGAITEEMIAEYRRDPQYAKDLNKIKVELSKGNLSGIYRHYYDTRVNESLKNADPTLRKESYTSLPADLKTSTTEKNNALKTLVTVAEKEFQTYKYYEIDGTSKTITDKAWIDVKNDLDKVITNENWFTKDEIAALNTQFYIDGYDISNTLGGTWVGKMGFNLESLRKLYGNDKESNPRWTKVQSKLNELTANGTLQYDETSDRYLFKNKQYIVPSHVVSQEYYRNTFADDNSIIRTGTEYYNTAIAKFNSGESVAVYPLANNTVASLSQNIDSEGNVKYSLSYNDLMNMKKTEIYDDIAEATRSILNYNQIIMQASASLTNHPSVRMNSGTTFGSLTNTVASNMVSKVVQGYIGSKANTKEFKTAVKASPHTDKITMTAADNGNTIQIDTTKNDYGSRSVINVLRQIAYVTGVDSYGNPVYDPTYLALSEQDRSDLSDNSSMNKPINMETPYQKAMIRQIFGVDNIEILYPDNGNSGSIIIKVKQ
jgi:hypothetical protein